MVEDEPAIRDVLCRALELSGYEIVAMHDGLAGLQAARVAAVPYDLVVTNSHMPRLNGEELIGRLRELQPDLPILYLDDLAKPLGRNAQEVPRLHKPFSVQALLEAVASALESPP